MRVLFLSSHLPLPNRSGGCQREYEIFSQLAQRCDLTGVFVARSMPDSPSETAPLNPIFDKIYVFPSPEPHREIGAVLRDNLPYEVRRNNSSQARSVVAEITRYGTFDILHCEGYYMYHLLPADAPGSVIVNQNIEADIARQNAALAGDDPLFLTEAAATLKHEVAAWQSAAACGFLTEGDLDRAVRLGCPAKTSRLTPNGKTRAGTMRVGSHRSEPPTLLYFGNHGYGPTLDGLRFFVEEIFSLILKQMPTCQLLVAGSESRDAIAKMARLQNVTALGWVKTLQECFDRADVFVCPLRCGGGIKMKMLDALAHSKAIVTTSIGMQGLEHYRDAVLVADDPVSFASAVMRVLRDDPLRRRLEASARRLWQSQPSWEDAADAVMALYQTALGDTRNLVAWL